MKSGLLWSPGWDATALLAACANWFEAPTTKLAKVYFGLRAPRRGRARRSACRRAELGKSSPWERTGSWVMTCRGPMTAASLALMSVRYLSCTHWRTRLFGASRWSCAGVIRIGLSGRISWLRSSTLTRSATRSRTRTQARSISEASELRTRPSTAVHNVPSARNHRHFALSAGREVALASAKRSGSERPTTGEHTCCTTSRGEELLEAPRYKRCGDRAASEILHGRGGGGALDALPDGCKGPRGRVAHFRRALR